MKVEIGRQFKMPVMGRHGAPLATIVAVDKQLVKIRYAQSNGGRVEQWFTLAGVQRWVDDDEARHGT